MPLASPPVVNLSPLKELSDFIPELDSLFIEKVNYIEAKTPLKSVHLFRHPEDIRQIYTSPQTATAKPTFILPRVKRIMRNGLFINPGGDLWKVKRRSLQGIFSRNNSETLSLPIFDALDSMMSRWQRYECENQPIDIDTEFRLLTTDYFFRSFFSEQLPHRELKLVAEKAHSMVSQFLELMPLLLPFPSHIQYLGNVRWFDDYFGEKIRLHADNQPDVIQSLLDLIGRGDQKIEWDLASILNELYSLFFGMGNLACALIWTIYCLGKNQTDYRSVQQEVDSLDTQPTDFAKQPITTSAFHESVRLFPPVWGYPRIAESPVKIGERTFAKNSILLPLGFYAQRHPEFWDNPDEFRGARFIHENKDNIHKFAHYPFGGGPRICLGKHLALFISQTVIGRIARDYDFQLLTHPGNLHDIDLNFGFELGPKSPLQINIEKR